MEPNYLTIADMAVRFQKSERTIARWCKDGVLPYIKLGAGRSASLYFDWEDVRRRLREKFGFNLQ